jgi:glycine cleavage system aminomethyltransferase T
MAKTRNTFDTVLTFNPATGTVSGDRIIAAMRLCRREYTGAVGWEVDYPREAAMRIMVDGEHLGCQCELIARMASQRNQVVEVGLATYGKVQFITARIIR